MNWVFLLGLFVFVFVVGFAFGVLVGYNRAMYKLEGWDELVSVEEINRMSEERAKEVRTDGR